MKYYFLFFWIAIFVQSNNVAAMELEKYPSSLKEKYPYLCDPLAILNIAAAVYCGYQGGTALYEGKCIRALEQCAWTVLHGVTATTIAQQEKDNENIALLNLIGGFAQIKNLPPSPKPWYLVATKLGLTAVRIVNAYYLSPSTTDDDE